MNAHPWIYPSTTVPAPRVGQWPLEAAMSWDPASELADTTLLSPPPPGPPEAGFQASQSERFIYHTLTRQLEGANHCKDTQSEENVVGTPEPRVAI